MKILAVYLSPRPLISADLSASLCGGHPVLIAGDLNAKHVDWNSRLITTKGRLLRDYANENSCLIYGPDTHHYPIQLSAAPDDLDIVLTRNLVTPVHLKACSALSSGHLSVLIDTRCRTSFLNLLERSALRRTDWAKFKFCLEDRLPSNLKLPNDVEFHSCV